MKLISLLIIAANLELTGCVSNDLAALQAKLPANSFDKIKVGLAIGPFNHTATFMGGVKQTDGTLAINSVEGATTFMSWGSSLEINNLRISPAPPPAPVPSPPAVKSP